MKKNILSYFVRNLSIVIGLVLMWRGTWYVLDWFDNKFLNDNHLYSALIGIIAGLTILYLPDKDLKEIESL